jgi:hypothetical protein
LQTRRSPLGATLTDRGYTRHGFENVLGLTLDGESPGPNSSGVPVDVVTDAEYATWIDIAVEKFTNLDGSGSVPPDALTPEHLTEVPQPSALRTPRLSRRGSPLAAGRWPESISHLRVVALQRFTEAHWVWWVRRLECCHTIR